MGRIFKSLTKIPPDDILESLYKLRIRESDQLKTAMELYDMEIHQKISMHNYQKLKIMDASAIHFKRLNAKEVIFPKEMEILYAQSQMEQSKFLEKIRF